MTRFERLLALLLTLIALTSIVPIRAKQQQSSDQKKDDNINLKVDLVTLDAQVLKQKTDRIAWKLKQEDFIVSEDGVRQKVTNFSQDTLPLSVILLIDRRGSQEPFNEKVQAAVNETIKTLKPEDEIAVMVFSDKSQLLQAFQTDRAKTAKALKGIPYMDVGIPNHCFNVGLNDAATYMRQAANPSGRRVIIVFTDTYRGINRSSPSTDDANRVVLESGSTVCAMIVSSTGSGVGNIILGGITGAAKATGQGTFNVKSLVEETGGEYTSVSAANVEFQFDNLLTRIRTRYAIGYVSSNPKHDGSYRKLKVEITPEAEKREGKLVVKARQGYIASAEKK